jgi:hypothetical protein
MGFEPAGFGGYIITGCRLYTPEGFQDPVGFCNDFIGQVYRQVVGFQVFQSDHEYQIACFNQAVFAVKNSFRFLFK